MTQFAVAVARNTSKIVYQFLSVHVESWPTPVLRVYHMCFIESEL
jgi:hypothetical protein